MIFFIIIVITSKAQRLGIELSRPISFNLNNKIFSGGQSFYFFTYNTDFAQVFLTPVQNSTVREK